LLLIYESSINAIRTLNLGLIQ